MESRGKSARVRKRERERERERERCNFLTLIKNNYVKPSNAHFT